MVVWCGCVLSRRAGVDGYVVSKMVAAVVWLCVFFNFILSFACFDFVLTGLPPFVSVVLCLQTVQFEVSVCWLKGCQISLDLCPISLATCREDDF